MTRLIYLGCYKNSILNPQGRLADAAASTKIEYISNALAAAGFEVLILSPTFVQKANKLFQYTSASVQKIREGVCCYFGPVLSYSSRVSGLMLKVWLCLYFLRNIRKGDTVIVYHSLWYADLVRWLKVLLRFELILEVEEIYTIAFKLPGSTLKKEKKIITRADKYIFCNDLMSTLLQIDKGKQWTVVYGQYTYLQGIRTKLFTDGKMHVVYAGSIDRLRLAAHKAVSAAAFLPDNYVIHVLGFGSMDVIEEVKCLIAESNNIAACKVIYEGAKYGEEYSAFLSSCDIGLNTQIAEGDYMRYAFPSKLLVYFSHGLNVVTAKLETLPLSKLDPILNYYKGDDGKNIAEAILNAKLFTQQNIMDILGGLHEDLVSSFQKLLKNGTCGYVQ
jgi:hypothetical protein